MRRIAIKLGLVTAVAVGLGIAFSSAASAKIVEPGSAYQPPPDVPFAKEAAVPSASPAPAPKEEAREIKPAPATPAPEQMVTRAQTTIGSTSSAPEHASPLQRVMHPIRGGFHRIGSYLDRVASSCPVGLQTGTGGPVLVLAVLVFGLALTRPWVLATQAATDESVPEFLYALELTPPG